jgi:enterochelin esterase family protein
MAVGPRRIRFAYPDPAGAFESVRLAVDANLPGPRELSRDGSGWSLDWPLPAGLDRLEYHFEVGVGGHRSAVADPAARRRLGSAFGDRSVWTHRSYRAPRWLRAEAPEGRLRRLEVAAGLRHPVPVVVWSPAGVTARRRLPLLLAHDGPEYAARSDLPRFSASMIHANALPPHRIAMVQPVDRFGWYSAGRAYLRATLDHVLPAVRAEVATTSVVPMGASLGGLTALLLALAPGARDAGVVGAFAQSGSFFTHQASPDDSGWVHFDRVDRVVRRIARGRPTREPIDLALTCGTLEGNARNNRDMAVALAGLGHRVTLAEGRDLHNHTAWRDAFDPHLVTLLRTCWG